MIQSPVFLVSFTSYSPHSRQCKRKQTTQRGEEGNRQSSSTREEEQRRFRMFCKTPVLPLLTSTFLVILRCLSDGDFSYSSDLLFSKVEAPIPCKTVYRCLLKLFCSPSIFRHTVKLTRSHATELQNLSQNCSKIRCNQNISFLLTIS